MNKKILSIFVAACVLISAGCSDSESSSAQGAATETTAKAAVNTVANTEASDEADEYNGEESDETEDGSGEEVTGPGVAGLLAGIVAEAAAEVDVLHLLLDRAARRYGAEGDVVGIAAVTEEEVVVVVNSP